ncbi:MAG: 3-oxoadipate enol-lactonase, partial [Proteobacteria bacterium]|nr:3-oxoadipate enol-lactonase [Pseudomonadota bacterium]
ERIVAMLQATAPAGYTAACLAIRDMDQRAQIADIRVPTLVIAWASDQATPVADGRFVAGKIAEARYVELAAAHLSNIEAADDFTAALVNFLSG